MKERVEPAIDDLINEPGSIGEEMLPAVDVGKTDKAPWTLAADKSKIELSRRERNQEHWSPFEAL